ncbi:MAG: DNA-deoxyinosine glycosylase [Peptoniphilus sp.]|nr:DNA-deoxyinosine glycosylase [Peptoniphilus sp.]
MKDQRYQTLIHTLKPVYDENSKILILGSFPSVKSREENFFYANSQNRFWKLISILLEEEIDKDAKNKKIFLLKHNIALYDVVYKCDIIGSMDSSIKNVEPTDLKSIKEKSNLKKIFCNGGLSHRYYNKYHRDALNMEAIKLPGTSSANARYRLEDLIESWKIILDYLKS